MISVDGGPLAADDRDRGGKWSRQCVAAHYRRRVGELQRMVYGRRLDNMLRSDRRTDRRTPGYSEDRAYACRLYRLWLLPPYSDAPVQHVSLSAQRCVVECAFHLRVSSNGFSTANCSRMEDEYRYINWCMELSFARRPRERHHVSRPNV